MSKELLRKLQEEKFRRLQMKYYAQNPIKWLSERFGEQENSFIWELWGEQYKTHIWDGSPNPLAEAWLALARGQWVGVESATGTGKTYWLARVVFWFLDCFEGSLVVTSAPVASQLKTQLWSEIKTAFHKFKRLRPYAELYDSLRLVVDARGFDELNDDEQNLNAWQAIAVASKASSGSKSNVSRQGFHRKDMLIITEETPGMDLASMEAYENTSTGEHNLILAVGNPDSQTDTLHLFCKKENVVNFRISAYDHPNVILNKEVIAGAVTRQSIERRRLQYGEGSAFFASRMRGISPAQASNSLIQLVWIEEAFQKELEGDYTANACGIDVANSQTGDKAAVAYGKANKLLYLKEFQCPDASHLAYNVALSHSELLAKSFHIYNIPNIFEYEVTGEYIGVDSVGVGTSTINTLHNIGLMAQGLAGGAWQEVLPKDTNGKLLYNFASLRSQMYWELREDLRLGKVAFNIEKETFDLLKAELIEPRYSVSDKIISVEKKENIKQRLGKSPNLADAVVYWNWIRKGYYKKKNEYLPFG